MKRKYLLAIGLSFLLASSLLILITWEVILHFVQIEEETLAQEEFNFTIRKINQEAEQLQTLAENWGRWDQVSNSILLNQNELLEANYSEQTLQSNQIDFLLITDSNHQTLLEVFDPTFAQTIHENNAESQLAFLKDKMAGSEDQDGIFFLASDPVFYSIEPIGDENETPPVGWLVIGRQLSDISLLPGAETTGLNMMTSSEYAEFSLNCPIHKCVQKENVTIFFKDQSTLSVIGSISNHENTQLYISVDYAKKFSNGINSIFSIFLVIIIALTGLIFLIHTLVANRFIFEPLNQARTVAAYLSTENKFIQSPSKNEISELSEMIGFAESEIKDKNWLILQDQSRFETIRKFEALLTEISSDLISASLENFSVKILGAMEKISKFYCIDHIFFAEKIDEQSTLAITYRWDAAQDLVAGDFAEFIPIEKTASWIEKLTNGEIVRVPSIQELTPPQIEHWEFVAHASTGAILVVPHFENDTFSSFMGFLSYSLENEWMNSETQLLVLSCEIIARAIQQKKAMAHIHRMNMQFQSMIEMSPEAIIGITGNQITLFNQSAMRLLNIKDPDQFIGREIQTIDEIDNIDEVVHFLQKAQFSTHFQEMELHLRNGINLEIQVAGIFYFHEDVPSIQLIMRDLTLQNRLQRNKQEQEKYIQTLNELSLLASSALDYRSTLQILADHLGEAMSADGCFITLWDQKTKSTIPAAAYGPFRDSYRSFQTRPGDTTITSHIASLQKTLLIEDARNSPFVSSNIAENFPSRTMIGIPMIVEDNFLGAVLISYERIVNISETDVDRAEKLVGPISLAISKANLFENLKKSHLDLERAYNATIEGWAMAIELRDEETEGHTRRVSDLAVRLGKRCNIPPEEMDDLYRGALLHDIGKLGIPDHILLKPGKLTDDEMTIMKTHTTLGKKMIEAIDFLQNAIDIPFCHHEKWDGSGYPCGLSGTEIPRKARIFSICDVWDALTSNRPYRLPWSPDKVANYLEERAGRDFDPEIVPIFLQMVKEMGIFETQPR